MDQKVISLNKAVRQYDPRLYVKRLSSGMIQVRRKAAKLGDADYDVESALSGPPSYFILALTDNWQKNGKATDWGIEPVIARLRSMDLQSTHHSLEEMRVRREQLERDKQRQFSNEIRARAADMRKDFAKAVNDINTSTLEKVDNRRLKDGYCK